MTILTWMVLASGILFGYAPQEDAPIPLSPYIRSDSGPWIQSVQIRSRVSSAMATTRIEIEITNPTPSTEGPTVQIFLPLPSEGQVDQGEILFGPDLRRFHEYILSASDLAASPDWSPLLEFTGRPLWRSQPLRLPNEASTKLAVNLEHRLERVGLRGDFQWPRSEVPRPGPRESTWRLHLDVQAMAPIVTVFSPHHDVRWIQREPGRIDVLVEGEDAAPPGDYFVSWLEEAPREDVEATLSASFFTYPDPGFGGGYFLLLAGSSASDSTEPVVDRELILVLDKSGSMTGERMDRVREASLKLLGALEDGERFNIIDYATTVDRLYEAPQEKNPQTLQQAEEYLGQVRPGGGTNIYDALEAAFSQPHAPGTLPLVLFLTDGLPTVSRIAEGDIRELAQYHNPHHRRVFTLGLGTEFNVPLLDRVASITRANSTYVVQPSRLGLTLRDLFARLRVPRFTGWTLGIHDAWGESCDDLVMETRPSPIPDLFLDESLILVGRYQTSDPIEFRLSAVRHGRPETYALELVPAAADPAHAFVPRIWAARTLADKIETIRQDEESVEASPWFEPESSLSNPVFQDRSDEILRLSVRYGIVSDYTSFLTREETELQSWKELSLSCGLQLDSGAVRDRTGEAAVVRSCNLQDLQAQTRTNYMNSLLCDSFERTSFDGVRPLGDASFFLRGNLWIDSRIILAAGGLSPDRVVQRGDEAFVEVFWRAADKGLAGIMALCGDVLLLDEGARVLLRKGP